MTKMHRRIMEFFPHEVALELPILSLRTWLPSSKTETFDHSILLSRSLLEFAVGCLVASVLRLICHFFLLLVRFGSDGVFPIRLLAELKCVTP